VAGDQKSGTTWPSPPCKGEMFVDRAHSGGSLADGGGDTLGRAGPEIAHGEQTWAARLEGQRVPSQHLPPLVQAFACEGPVGDHEVFIVEHDKPRPRASGCTQRCSTSSDSASCET
jgi:hypothetical protein